MDRSCDPVDISSIAFWRQTPRERDEAFAQLRARRTLGFHRPIELGTAASSPGFWAAVKYDDIVHVSRRSEDFCSGKGVGFSDIPPEYNEAFGSFLMTDAPRHTSLRRLVSRAFTPKQVTAIEAQIQEQARVIVADAVSKGGPIELVSDLSMRLPLWTISEMLGVPIEQRDDFRDNADLMIAGSDPELLAKYSDPFTKIFTAAIALTTLGSELAVERRQQPTDDLLTALVQAEVDGERLTNDEIGAFVVLLGSAGNDTTRNSITHGITAFAENPDQWDLLRSDPSKWLPGAVEEVLRWATPVMTFRRTARADTMIGEQPISEGDHVVMFYSSGNRDENVFEDPWRFDIRRDPNPHIGFGGGGPHFCLGASLARTQLMSVFRELATSVKRFEVGRQTKLDSAFVNGVRSLECQFELELSS